MINFDGTCYFGLDEVPLIYLKLFSELPIHTHHLVAIEGKIPLLEAHYFSIMAALRRSRVVIPMEYTLEYFQEQADLIYSEEEKGQNYTLLSLSFYRKENPSLQQPVSAIGFYMKVIPEDPKSEAIAITLYKDYPILADPYSNLYQTNEPLRKLAAVFAYENNFGACLILNNDKKVVESTRGTLFLIQDQRIFTPPISSGVVNSVSRTALIDFLEKNTSYEVVQDNIAVFDLQRVAEFFLFSFEHGFTKISQFRKKEYGTEASVKLEVEFFNYLKDQL